MSNTKGVAKLPDAQEQMRLQVVELELRARYWKAQWEVRYYTLEAEKVQPEYDKWMARFEEQINSMKEKGASVLVDGQPLDLQADVTKEAVSEMHKTD